MGDEVVPGQPDKSVLVELIEGKRGTRQRMPQDSIPLSARQISLIRRWILEGAMDDRARTLCSELRISRIAFPVALPLEIDARIPANAFLTLMLRDPISGRELYREEASVKSPRERADIAAAGELIQWQLRRQQGWPPSATVTLRLQYASEDLSGSELEVRSGSAVTLHASELHTMTCSSN